MLPHLACLKDAIGRLGLGYCANASHQEERCSTACMSKSNPEEIYLVPEAERRGKTTESGGAIPNGKYGGRESA